MMIEYIVTFIDELLCILHIKHTWAYYNLNDYKGFAVLSQDLNYTPTPTRDNRICIFCHTKQVLDDNKWRRRSILFDSIPPYNK